VTKKNSNKVAPQRFEVTLTGFSGWLNSSGKALLCTCFRISLSALLISSRVMYFGTSQFKGWIITKVMGKGEKQKKIHARKGAKEK